MERGEKERVLPVWKLVFATYRYMALYCRDLKVPVLGFVFANLLQAEVLSRGPKSGWMLILVWLVVAFANSIFAVSVLKFGLRDNWKAGAPILKVDKAVFCYLATSVFYIFTVLIVFGLLAYVVRYGAGFIIIYSIFQILISFGLLRLSLSLPCIAIGDGRH